MNAGRISRENRAGSAAREVNLAATERKNLNYPEREGEALKKHHCYVAVAKLKFYRRPTLCLWPASNFARPSMRSTIRASIGAAKRKVWQSEVSVVFSIPANCDLMATPGISFLGLNGLREDGESGSELELPEPYCEFATRGDAALIGLVGQEVAGWMWVRRGPYDEAIGCGVARISPGISIIRHFEVPAQWRGRGIGRSILIEGARRFRARTSERGIAFVGVGNTASLKAFTTAGYPVEGKTAFRRILGTALRVNVDRAGNVGR